MIAFFCRTPIHIFRTIQLKYEMFEKEKVDVYVFSSFNGASNIVQRLKKINIFENDSKNNSILSLLKIFLLVYTLKQTLGQLNQSKRF